MPEKSHHHFHLRLPEDVFSFLMEKKGASLNKEIIGRLRGSMTEGHADDLAGALRPILNSIDPADRDEFVTLAVRALEILAKGRARKRRRT